MKREEILKGKHFKIKSCLDLIFWIKNRNWNDFGYYTLYQLLFKFKDSNENYSLANLRIFNKNQSKKEEEFSYDDDKAIVMLNERSDGEQIFLYLTPQQRLELINILQLQFHYTPEPNEECFYKSVCRGCGTSERFEAAQKICKELVFNKLNVREMINQYPHKLQFFLKEYNERPKI